MRCHFLPSFSVHAAPPGPVITTVRAKLAKDFGLANPHQVPRIVKIVLNVGLGEGSKNPRLVDAAVEELGIVTGQKAVITRAKKAIAEL